ncbi:DUF6643 family protein [Streptomyces sp. NPDC059080]|uniref:DUF6643 family protein n=1 Tax=Streptomyces sp. NPDC059080 TaxID=3346718 RepID=UPI0036AE78DF
MTSPRSTYGGGYYASPSFPDTPIYDSLVAERGTPQIAPIRVNPAPYDTGSSYLPALPAALPAAPSHPSPGQGHPGVAAPVAPLQYTPAPYIPQQAVTRGHPAAPQPPRPPMGTGYEAMRPAAPVAPAPQRGPAPYDDPYGRSYQPRGY